MADAHPEAHAGARADPRRRTFGPVVLAGLAGAALAAVAGHQVMLEAPGDVLSDLGVVAVGGQGTTQVEFPLAGALALVALAGWGVVLVARGRVRQVVAALAALAAAGVLAVVVIGGFVQHDDAARDVADQLGIVSIASASPLELDRSVWLWVALGASAIATAAGAAAVRLAPSWPEMGSRYDAPGAAAPAETTGAPAEERSGIDLWKSLDEGDDPTT